jgi:hypothetical protein
MNVNHRIHRIRVFLAASALFAVAAVTFSLPARAGALQIRDTEHVLSADAAARLRQTVTSAPFDGRFVVTSEYPDTQDLSRYVGSLVTEPNVVVVGLDPQHRHVQVHFGNGDRVPRSEWPAIERAGNDAFHRSDWAGGAAAIFQAASRAAVSAAGQAAAPNAQASPSLFGPGLLLLLLVGGLGIALYLARRRSAYGSRGGPGYGVSPPYPQGYPMPPQSGVGPLGGGIIGAGLGGLAGYELGKYEGERGREPDDRAGFGNDRGGNFDAGGGGSSWDDGSGGSGGGGGFDGGGGGGDGGGGGSDF